MRSLYLALVLSLCATFCHAQAATDDATFLKQARAKYDAPFGRNLQSFSCAVEFDWKQHFTEAVRVGDEGTDEEIAKLIQPIRTHVTVSRQNAAVSSGMTEDEERRLPHGGMAEGLLEHAVQFSLNSWLVASNNAMLPSEGTPVHVEPSASGYKLEFKIQAFDVEMLLARDLSLLMLAVLVLGVPGLVLFKYGKPRGYLLDLVKYYALPRSYCACAHDRKLTNEFIVDPDEMEIG